MSELTSLLALSLAMATPLIYGSLGGLFTYKAGVLNIAIEGMMTAGAFGSVFGVYLTRSVFWGGVVGIVIALLMGLIFAFFTVTLKGHNVISSLALNMAAASIVPFISLQLFNNRTSVIVTDIAVPSEIALDIPILRDIPILNEIFNNLPPLTYIALISIPLVSILLYKTKFGVYTRVCGENPESAKSLGISVNLVRYATILMSAFFSALAGINLAVESLGMYTDGMVSGRGFICLAAIYCGKGKPLNCVAYAMLFGIARAGQVKVITFFDAATGSLIEMIPYALIVVAMFITAVNSRRSINVRGFKGE